MATVTTILATCFGCGYEEEVDATWMDLIALGSRLVLTWLCGGCGDGIAAVPPHLGRRVLDSGARVQQSALDLAARTHGPLL